MFSCRSMVVWKKSYRQFIRQCLRLQTGVGVGKFYRHQLRFLLRLRLRPKRSTQIDSRSGFDSDSAALLVIDKLLNVIITRQISLRRCRLRICLHSDRPPVGSTQAALSGAPAEARREEASLSGRCCYNISLSATPTVAQPDICDGEGARHSEAP